MQAASARTRRGHYLPRLSRMVPPSFSPLRADFAIRLLCLTGEDPSGKAFELPALLLFALPSELTFQKLLELPLFAERSHQLTVLDANRPEPIVFMLPETTYSAPCLS